jgi:hypothetical protein
MMNKNIITLTNEIVDPIVARKRVPLIVFVRLLQTVSSDWVVILLA